MYGTMLYGPGDIRYEERPEPRITAPGDAIVRIAATCVCGSDLWYYRGISPFGEPWAIGHEYCGVVTETGDAVTSVEPGQFVIGSFWASDNTCPNCQAGFQSACQHRELMTGCQAERVRVPMADGTLVATPGQPAPELIPGLLALSDVMGTGWFAAAAAGVRPGMTVAVVGDGAVGLCGILAAARLGARRIIASSRNPARQAMAREFGATEIIAERGAGAVARIKELTDGVGADAVLECVGTGEAMDQAIRSARAGAFAGFVGVPHGVNVSGETLFGTLVGVYGGPAPVRRFLPELIDLVWKRELDPGRVFDLTLPLDRVAEAYRAMDERRAIKPLLIPG